MTDFTVFRTDRSLRRQGGVALYIKEPEATTFKTILSYSNQYVEILSTYSQKKFTSFTVIYRPPDTPDERFAEALKEIRSTLDSLPLETTHIFTGDLNFPKIEWKNGACSNDNFLTNH